MQGRFVQQSKESSARKESPALNQQFLQFLHINENDLAILARYREVLQQGKERFARIFYDYLYAFPATAQVLEAYQAQGNHIEHLVKRQTEHLVELLSGNITAESAAHMMYIGEVHYRYNIEPVWIMGAYWLYLDHLQTIMASSSAIEAQHRAALEDAVIKLLFRDMGMLLEGYWNAAFLALHQEKDRVSELQSQVQSMLRNIPQLLWSVDVVSNHLLYVSPTTRQICPIAAEMPIPCLGWTVPSDRELVERAWQRALQGERIEVESRVHSPGGSERWFRRVFHPFLSAEGKVVRVDGVMEDISDTKETREQLRRLATTDTLTGLPNRMLWYDRVTQAIAAARRERGRQVAVMILDLNHFKIINDTLGHPTGDEILYSIAQRLRTALRETDTLARLGGDEFAILLPDVKSGVQDAGKVAENILACFSEPLWHEDNEIYLGAAIGIAVYPDHGRDVDTLVRRADIAMYGAKGSHTGHLFYNAETDTNTAQRLQLSSDLRHALQRDELELYYQPKVHFSSRRMKGVEALLRWHHPQQGLLEPGQFLPLAEQTGLINSITEWVLKRAAAQAQAWRADGLDLPIAVNVSPRTFQSPRFVEMLRDALSEYSGNGALLETEITENVLMADIARAQEVLGKLGTMGVATSIDDFGTGYSSLAYLKQLPIDTLKIDKSFVLDMAHNENDAMIVRSIIDLGHNLGFEVVAEGVETAEVMDLLESLGCDYAQGYHIGRPMPATDLRTWLAGGGWHL
ncbi:MAG: EAL domain-containing protein [Gammaproteobacteria bacterium]|nr:EAL domain-containing protein [Gammaproteobacteria bacterium]